MLTERGKSGFLSSVDGVNDIPFALRPVLKVFSRSDKHYIFNNNPQIQNLLATPAQYLQSSQENLDTAKAAHAAARAATTAAVDKLKGEARTRYNSALAKLKPTNPATMQVEELDQLTSALKQPSAKTKSRDLNELISILEKQRSTAVKIQKATVIHNEAESFISSCSVEQKAKHMTAIISDFSGDKNTTPQAQIRAAISHFGQGKDRYSQHITKRLQALLTARQKMDQRFQAIKNFSASFIRAPYGTTRRLFAILQQKVEIAPCMAYFLKSALVEPTGIFSLDLGKMQDRMESKDPKTQQNLLFLDVIEGKNPEMLAMMFSELSSMQNPDTPNQIPDSTPIETAKYKLLATMLPLFGNEDIQGHLNGFIDPVKHSPIDQYPVGHNTRNSADLVSNEKKVGGDLRIFAEIFKIPTTFIDLQQKAEVLTDLCSLIAKKAPGSQLPMLAGIELLAHANDNGLLPTEAIVAAVQSQNSDLKVAVQQYLTQLFAPLSAGHTPTSAGNPENNATENIIAKLESIPNPEKKIVYLKACIAINPAENNHLNDAVQQLQDKIEQEEKHKDIGVITTILSKQKVDSIDDLLQDNQLPNLIRNLQKPQKGSKNKVAALLGADAPVSRFFSKIRTLSTQEAEKDDTTLAAILAAIVKARDIPDQADHNSTDTSVTRRKIAEIIIDSVIGSTVANIADSSPPPEPLSLISSAGRENLHANRPAEIIVDPPPPPPPPLIPSAAIINQQPNKDAQVREFEILLKRAYNQRHESVKKKLFRGRGRNPQSGNDYEDSISQQLQKHYENLGDKIAILRDIVETKKARGLSKNAVNAKLGKSNSTSPRTPSGR